MERWEISDQLRKKMTEVARLLRRTSTGSETILWESIRGRKFRGKKFRRQQKFGPFVVDFFCAEERLVVEIDGFVHENQKDLDKERQELLESLGLRFFRVSASDVEKNLSGVLAELESFLKT